MPKKKTQIKAFPKSNSNNRRVDKTVEEVLGEYKRKVYKNPFDARKAADDEDRQNLKEIRAVEAKGMTHGGEAVTQGAGSAIRGTSFKGVF